ncbi:hypothetical protein EV196_102100 [Mariniflexile fucanivorans]|uniref:Uncharacterized protein n=1 Tax=Mariniflexile fucanivorans TaxID=264023 RepID=A0A4R1RMW4_9FLAO|nr:hypothetical protein [Mariniflexile fucanivorans]TCL67544.1 hypothetical protein EV196_102100 [Mariniflexile fucanivorans]
MKISASVFSNHILNSKKLNLGDIYFFHNFAVVEFNEGVHIDIYNSDQIFDELNNYYGYSKPFGVIANRVNSYSVNLLDIDLFREKSKNLCAYAVVGHNFASKMNAVIENSFCENDTINYDNLHEAIDALTYKLRKCDLAI